MGVHIILPEPLVHDHLIQHSGMHILRLLAHGHFGQHRLGAYAVGYPQTRGQDLGEGTGIDHNAVRIHTLNGGQRLTGHPQVAIRVVLQDQHTILLGKGVHLLPFLQAHGGARGVLEIGNGVDKSGGRVLLQHPLQSGGVHTVCLHRHTGQLTTVGAEAVQRANKGRFLADHRIAFVAQHLGNQVHNLGRTADDQQIVPVGTDLFSPGKPVPHRVPQGLIPLGHAVLQGVNGRFLQNIGGNGPYLVHRKSVRRRVARCQRNNGRVGGSL